MDDSPIRRYSYNNERKQSIQSSTNTANLGRQLPPMSKRRFTTASGNEMGLSNSAITDLKKIFEK